MKTTEICPLNLQKEVRNKKNKNKESWFAVETKRYSACPTEKQATPNTHFIQSSG
jgi:hypothetical protein